MLDDDPHRHGGHGLHVLIGLVALAAALPVHLDATLDPDGRTITGTVTVPPGTALADPLARLPLPGDDLQGLRTFPGAVDRGRMTFEEAAPGVFTFTTRLPKRFGGIGATTHGTFALGGFHPQPLVDGALPEATWDARVTLPPGRTGALGDTVGEGTLTWTGVADRLTLAVPRRARVERVEAPGLSVTLLGRGRPRKELVRQTERVLPYIAHAEPWDVLLVEAPLRRRLMRTAPGVALVSDRAFRLTLHLRAYHRHAFVEGVAAAASRLPGALERDLVGVAVAERWRATRGGTGADGLTRAFAWVPSIDFLLSSQRMAFYSETLEQTLPSDPVRDDLAEVFNPFRPARMAAAQLDDRYGPGRTGRVAAGLRVGLTLPQALQVAGVDPGLAEAWRAPLPVQDYTLDVGEQAVVTRVVQGEAPAETVVIRVDGEDRPVEMAPGEVLRFERPSRILVDPARHVQQTSRMGDGWPQRRFRVVGTAGITSINLTRFRPAASGVVWVRGRYDTRNVLSGSVNTSRSTLIGGGIGWVHKRGPLIDGISRRHRFSVGAQASVIDPTFLSRVDGPLSVDLSGGWSFNTRVSSDFPQRGGAVGVNGGVGAFPGSASRWGDLGASGTVLLSAHPRHVIALRGTASIARSTRPDQLLGLAGLGAMRSLPVLPPCPRDGELCAPVATERAIGIVEYRMAPLRGLSVPFGLAWGTELQVTAGAEVLVTRTTDGPARALGATAGLAGLADILGAEPTMMGVTAGWLLTEHGLGYAAPLNPVPEVYLRWEQAF